MRDSDSLLLAFDNKLYQVIIPSRRIAILPVDERLVIRFFLAVSLLILAI